MAWVYILSGDNGRFYIGSTDNLERRLRQHHSGHTHSTQRLGKFSLAFSQEYATLLEARKIERKLKKPKRKDYIEKVIQDKVIKMTLE